MTPNFPKPMFWGQIHPGPVGTLTFCFFQKLTPRPLGPLKGAPGPVRGPFGIRSGPVRAHLGPPEPGPGYAADGSATAAGGAAAAGRTPSPGQAPLPSRPGTKYVAQGTLAATSKRQVQALLILLQKLPS